MSMRTNWTSSAAWKVRGTSGRANALKCRPSRPATGTARRLSAVPQPDQTSSKEVTLAFQLTINGDQHSVDVDDDTPLLWVLRDVLGMIGTKFGCGMALCGACTVHIDGVISRSCITPIDSVGTSNVTT